jgi:hypothetical protein
MHSPWADHCELRAVVSEHVAHHLVHFRVHRVESGKVLHCQARRASASLRWSTRCSSGARLASLIACRIFGFDVGPTCTAATQASHPDRPVPRVRAASWSHIWPQLGALIDRYVEDARTANGLEEDDRSSLVGSLKGLQRPSINQAGKRLVQGLGDRQYMDGEATQRSETATQFFRACYKVRNALVHGNLDRPAHDVMALRAAYLAKFVADLFAVELQDS